ncbi:unnamed protein product [Symbiodinium natans]|uniref:Uncharacterized protein n=1 Tax=Symbiodinium natans TaxID=878477 RepID=A0A812L9H5_9DINO|nr:unnamed protein product [Symbiodinium natans]
MPHELRLDGLHGQRLAGIGSLARHGPCRGGARAGNCCGGSYPGRSLHQHRHARSSLEPRLQVYEADLQGKGRALGVGPRRSWVHTPQDHHRDGALRHRRVLGAPWQRLRDPGGRWRRGGHQGRGLLARPHVKHRPKPSKRARCQISNYFKGLRPWAGSARRSPGRAVSKHVEAPKLP